MFQHLSEELQLALRALHGRAMLTENQTQEAVREIRQALLAADVHVDVVKPFTQRVADRARSDGAADDVGAVLPQRVSQTAPHDEEAGRDGRDAEDDAGGRTVQDLNRLMKELETMQVAMKRMCGGKMRALRQLLGR